MEPKILVVEDEKSISDILKMKRALSVFKNKIVSRVAVKWGEG